MMSGDTPSAGKEKRSLLSDWKTMPPHHRALLGLVLLYILSAGVVHLVSWARHQTFLGVELIAFGMLSMLALCVWHAAVMKGVRTAAAFFAICILVSWLAEYAGHNRGWFFGHYHYTRTLGPSVGGVPAIVIVTWSFIVYSSFMLVDWLLGLGGEVRGRSRPGRAAWSVLVSACTATLVCAWDMMVDPVATSGIWWTAAGKDPWWYWVHGGPYLRELPGKQGLGMPGVAVGNFVGWWVASFFMILVFMLFFQRRNRITGSLLETVPLLVYFYIYYSLALVALEMNWHFDGMNQVALIGTFTMLPVIMVGAVKLARDYTRGEASG